MRHNLDFVKLDLSKIVAIAHDGTSLLVLVETEEGFQVKSIVAPHQAYDGLQQLSKLVSLAQNSQFNSISREQALADIEMLPVSSSTIAAIGYSHLLEVLQVDFLKGDRYRYFNVSTSVFNAFFNADSKGRFLNIIKTEYNFDYQKVK